VFILFVVFVEVYLILILVHYQKKGFQFLRKDMEETCSRKMVLVPYGNGEYELGDYICTTISKFNNLSFICTMNPFLCVFYLIIV
jgi:glycogen synthase